jgi:hypothetical protein
MQLWFHLLQVGASQARLRLMPTSARVSRRGNSLTPTRVTARTPDKRRREGLATPWNGQIYRANPVFHRLTRERFDSPPPALVCLK